MRVILFSDFHAHAWGAYSRQIEWSGRFINSRLLDHVRVLDQIEQYALDNGISVVLFAGDLFHERQRVNTSVFNTMFRKLMDMRRKGIDFYLLPGNHDQIGTDTNTDHALMPFKTFCTVMDSPGVYHIAGGPSVYACPFVAREDKVPAIMAGMIDKREPETSDIMVLHQGLKGAKVGPTDWLLQDGLDVLRLPVDEFRHTFLGHYHTHQVIQADVMYIGSTLQTSWNDVGQTKYFIDYDTESGIVRKVETKAPRFIKVNQDDLIGFDFDAHASDFIRVLSRSLDKEDKDAFKKAYPDHRFEFIPLPQEKGVDSKLGADLSSSKDEVVEAYAKSGAQPSSHVDLSLLVDAGKHLVRGEKWDVSYGRLKVNNEEE